MEIRGFTDVVMPGRACQADVGYSPDPTRRPKLGMRFARLTPDWVSPRRSSSVYCQHCEWGCVGCGHSLGAALAREGWFGVGCAGWL